jgi:hypothetical protein
MENKEPTAAEIERKARELCAAMGINPDQIIGMSFMPPHPMRWMEFKQMAWAALSPIGRQARLPASHPFKAPRP